MFKASGEAAKKLYEEGANIFLVGIGPGSICTTRILKSPLKLVLL